MRIQKLDNITFGYNKRLNNRLVKELDKDIEKKDTVASTIKDLNTLCNNTEKKLNACENNSKESIYLYNTLASTKMSLAYLVEAKYPKLHFLDQEITSYHDDAVNVIKEKGWSAITWHVDLIADLEGLKTKFDSKALTPEQIERLKRMQAQALLNGTPNNKPKEAATPTKSAEPATPVKAPEPAAQKAQMPEVIEKFIPNQYSPKGFESLGGMLELKDELFDKIIYPTKNPEAAKLDFIEYGKRAPRGVILYGPPGCGKTSTVQALSQEAQLPLFVLKISKAGSRFINQTSNNYQNAFDYVADYAQSTSTPCIMLIDELDGLVKGRSSDTSSEDLKQIGTLLNLIETARDRNIVVIGATNKYDLIDDAIKRRFDSQIYVGMPDMDTRVQVLFKTLAQWSKGEELAQNANDLYEIANKLNSYPTSAITIIADKASAIARKDGRRPIQKEDFFTEIEKNQNLKIKEANYKAASERKSIGYSN